MAQAIMDPEEVRRFASELKRFNDDVQVRASALQARFTSLGGTWQDQEHEKFRPYAAPPAGWLREACAKLGAPVL